MPLFPKTRARPHIKTSAVCRNRSSAKIPEHSHVAQGPTLFLFFIIFHVPVSCGIRWFRSRLNVLLFLCWRTLSVNQPRSQLDSCTRLPIRESRTVALGIACG